MTNNGLHFWMPAEFTTHQKTLMSWPVKESMCYPENYQEFTEGLAQAALAISRFEPVVMLVNDDTHADAQLALQGNAELINIAHNDCWLRDNGPTFVLDEYGTVAGISWQFNAWGEKYPDYTLDNLVATKLLKDMCVTEIPIPLVMEGGSFHTDGEGTLLTTKECLLHQNRNANKSQKEITSILQQVLGVQKILWLEDGLFADETDGHVDNVACFAAPGVVLIQVCTNLADPNYQRSQKHLRYLETQTDARGRAIEVIPIPEPSPVLYRNKRLTLSYLNFYFVNNGIILPVFNQETDQEAIRILQTVFPERELVPIDGLKLVKEGGNIHCLTQQVPIGG